MSLLEQMIREQVRQMLNEAGEARLSVHPFANHLANQRDTTPQENLYDDIVNATIMQMVTVYGEDDIKDMIRGLTQKAAIGIGQDFTDEQVQEILELVYDKVDQKLNINLRSYMPEDREHALFTDTE